MSNDDKPKENILSIPLDNPALLHAKGQERAESEAGIVREVSTYGKTGEINMQCNPNERELAMRIAMRGAEFMCHYGVQEDILTAAIDIVAVHLNYQPLRLLSFALADVTDFAHDYATIRRLINRTTGRLPDGTTLIFAEKPANSH